MDDKQLDFVMYIVGVIGLLILLGGIFGFYEFKYGLVGALAVWIIAGAVRKYPR